MRPLSAIIRAVMPHALHEYLYITRPAREEQRVKAESKRALLAYTMSNRDFRSVHSGRRGFILCNGPSVKKQDIRPLKDEIVISVSNGYHHPHYGMIAPRYHCVPQITYGTLTRADVIVWFKEMHGKLGNATVFLSHTEKALIQEEQLFQGRDVRYVVLQGSFADYSENAIPNISEPIAGAQSVPIMALQVAMYMGLNPIYLLGVDHDHFRTKEYKYFYEPTVLRGKDASTDADGNLRSKWYDELNGLAALWRQYRSARKIAEANGVKIFNATAGGELDEFPRVSLDAIFSSSLALSCGPDLKPE